MCNSIHTLVDVLNGSRITKLLPQHETSNKLISSYAAIFQVLTYMYLLL